MAETARDCQAATYMAGYGHTTVALPGYGNLSQCVALGSCPGILDRPDAPVWSALPCGYDEATSQLMVELQTKFHKDITITVMEKSSSSPGRK